jgi:hypothetical protein
MPHAKLGWQPTVLPGDRFHKQRATRLCRASAAPARRCVPTPKRCSQYSTHCRQVPYAIGIVRGGYVAAPVPPAWAVAGDAPAYSQHVPALVGRAVIHLTAPAQQPGMPGQSARGRPLPDALPQSPSNLFHRHVWPDGGARSANLLIAVLFTARSPSAASTARRVCGSVTLSNGGWGMIRSRRAHASP